MVAAGRESVARVYGAGIPGTSLHSYKIITSTEALLVQKYKYCRRGGRVLLESHETHWCVWWYVRSGSEVVKASYTEVLKGGLRVT